MKYIKLVDKQSRKICRFFPSLTIALEQIEKAENSQRGNLRDWLKTHDWELVNERGQKVRERLL